MTETTEPTDEGTTDAGTEPRPGDNQPTDPVAETTAAEQSGDPHATSRTSDDNTQVTQPGAAPTSSSNLTVTEVMGAATLPTPGGSGATGGPIATVYGKKAPDVWENKGWAENDTGKPNIGSGASGKVVTQTEKVTNATLDDAEATIIKTKGGEAAWKVKGWEVDDSGGNDGGNGGGGDAKPVIDIANANGNAGADITYASHMTNATGTSNNCTGTVRYTVASGGLAPADITKYTRDGTAITLSADGANAVKGTYGEPGFTIGPDFDASVDFVMNTTKVGQINATHAVLDSTSKEIASKTFTITVAS